MENVKTPQRRFLADILKLPDDEPCKEYALYIPPHGKRKPAKQGTLFLTYIQHLLGDKDNMIGQYKLSELAQDRCGWKKIVLTCSAEDRWWRWDLWYTEWREDLQQSRKNSASFVGSVCMHLKTKCCLPFTYLIWPHAFYTYNHI